MPDTGSKNPASPIKWNFSTYKDAKERTYVITYYNRWDSMHTHLSRSSQKMKIFGST
ncbi:MAG: hypothetical protein PUI29_08345 [Aeromonadales bacterium]|nr:hypothetical protein [Aeromonadales bacterium]MDY2890625.1 hypothetical protein [Succinivibrio sp.]